MAIGDWLRLRGRLRPWMVLVGLAAAPAAAGGCKKAESPAVDAERGVEEATSQVDGPAVPRGNDACLTAPPDGPLPECGTDEQCVELHGPGWVCESGTRELDDGCGGKIARPFGVCRPPAADAGPSGIADAGPSDVEETTADTTADDEAAGGDAPGSPGDDARTRRPAEMAQRVRDLASFPIGSITGGDRQATEAVGTYGAPDGASPVARGSVSLSGDVTVSGPGTIDRAAVLRQVRRQTPLVRACYDRALAQNPNLAGRLEFDIRISEDGGVTPTVAQDDAALQAAGVTRCILLRLRGVSFSSTPPQGGEVRAHFGLDFRPSS